MALAATTPHQVFTGIQMSKLLEWGWGVLLHNPANLRLGEQAKEGKVGGLHHRKQAVTCLLAG